MARSSEQISKYNTTGGKTDSNIANDALHLGGIPADEFATEKYVQNYHDAKEAIQKQYIDSQNASKLAEAKAYTDVVVENQDFSSFAKLTDVQALNTNLTNKINTDINDVESETDNKIAAVVRDVNEFNDNTTREINTIKGNINNINSTTANLQQQINTEKTTRANADTALQNRIGNAEGDISTLETKTEELFTSVSNGKRNVAAAITDKGVVTASDASFNTMAANIRQIEGGTDTSDATATEEDIMFGKTAYAQGYKRYGTHIDLDTSDATATGNDIKLGKSAYANGEKIYGYSSEVDTSDATATPYDILNGKVAYVNGERIVGTLDVSGEIPTYYGDSGIEKIYGGINKEYTLGRIPLYGNVASDGLPLYNTTTKELIAIISISSTALKFSYVWNDQIIGTTTTDLASLKNQLDETGIISGTCSLSVLGITPSNINKPYITLLYGTLYEQIVVLLPLEKNGSVTFGHLTIDSWSVDLSKSNYYGSLTLDINRSWWSYSFGQINEDYSKCYVFDYYGELYEIDINTDYLIIQSVEKIDAPGYQISQILPTISDKLHIIKRLPNDTRTEAIHRNYLSAFIYDNNHNNKAIFTLNAKTVTKDLMYGISSNAIYTYTIDYANLRIYETKICDLTCFNDCNNNDFYLVNNDNILVRYKLLTYNESQGTDFIYEKEVYTFDPTLIEGNNGDRCFTKMKNISEYCIDPKVRIIGESLIYNYCRTFTYEGITYIESLQYVTTTPGYQELIGIKYNGEYFYKPKARVLTAGQPDVRQGKTYIGWMGYPEVGTGNF